MATFTFPQAAKLLKAHEGGKTNYAYDGGPTNFGVTIYDFRRSLRNPHATAVRTMQWNQTKAKEIYWNAILISTRPEMQSNAASTR